MFLPCSSRDGSEMDMKDERTALREVVVRINGAQRAGTHRRIGGMDYVHYRESALESGQEAQSVQEDQILLKLSESSVEIVRSGMIRSRMIFEEGKRIPAEYETPYGRIEMEVAGKRLEVRREDGQIRIDLRYRLERAGEEITQNEVLIEILPARNDP